MKNELFEIAKNAGKLIINYFGTKSYSLKKDHSPVTLADEASHDYLKKSLREIRNIPVLSEESEVSFFERKNWSEYWLIDPLDGTKEFLNGNNDFCINIALLSNNKPILGLIYAPLLSEYYYSDKSGGFQYVGMPKKREFENGIICAVSRFHPSPENQLFITNNRLKHTLTVGAALKFGYLALGLVDVYPRFQGSKEWDICAGHIILKNSNCFILDLITFEEPLYNKENLKNNFFFAANNKINIKEFIF